MKAIILAAGAGSTSLDTREQFPKCLLPYNESSTVLDTILSAVRACGINDFCIVGGFEMLKIMQAYPATKYYYNERWESTGSLYSLLKASAEFDSDLLISFSDIVYSQAAVETISRSEADLTIAYDSQWETRYGGRGPLILADAVKVYVSDTRTVDISKHSDKGCCEGEFVGVILVKRKVVSELMSLIGELLKRDLQAHLGPLISDLSLRYSVSLVDVEGHWAELDSPQDLLQFRFGTKAETLERLQKRITKGKILEQVVFTVVDYKQNASEIIRRIRDRFVSGRVVVRSSASNEDTFEFSMAGRYKSILNVPLDSESSIRQAIDAVYSSYRQGGEASLSRHQIFVQPQLEGCLFSGVAFTQDLETGAPYHIVNYAYGERTDSVTSGSFESLHTFICSKDSLEAVKDRHLKRVLEVLKELEAVTSHQALDVEFAVTEHDVFVLQVRPIAAQKDAYRVYGKDVYREIRSIQKYLYDRDEQPMPGLVGKKTAYGVMPDWNPAEIIGINPAPLALSLYRYIITDTVWPESRRLVGYRDTTYNPGIVSLGGKPYVDVRMSFNSFTPRALPDATAAKLIDHYLDVLQQHPEYHDKVEFCVAITTYDLSFPLKMEHLRQVGFSLAETEMIEGEFRSLTNNIFCGRSVTIDEALLEVGKLAGRRSEVLSSLIPLESKIVKLLEDCKTYGTLPFSVLARYAFVGSILFRSILNEGYIYQHEYDGFYQSIHTVAKDFLEDVQHVADGCLSEGEFLNRHGHLRPGTYDIRSKTYRESYKTYIDASKSFISSKHDHVFVWERVRLEEITHVLSEHGLEFDAFKLCDFFRAAVEARERAKFEFTKNLSCALDLIVELAESFGLTRDDAAYLEIGDIVSIAAGSRSPNLENELHTKSRYNRAKHRLTVAIKLPELVFRPEDVEAFRLAKAKPNFITQKSVTGKPAVLPSQRTPQPGEIAFIENADPGYDWIFRHDIGGLVTKYGGVASHMAIRCAELGLPAAIGCGELLFERLRKFSRVRLECASQTIGPVT
jgi:choline kinase/phosphohistidine swiveling domain-containing protein